MRDSCIATIIALSAIAMFVMMRYPQFALHAFPAQKFDVQWGAYYYVNFPLWQIIAAGALASVIAFVWMLRRARTTG